MKRFDRYEVTAIISSVMFVLSSTTLVFYAIFLKSEPNSNSEMLPISDVQKCLEQLNCDDVNKCSGEIVRHCLKIKQPHQYKRQIPYGWFSNDSCKPYLSQVANEVMAEDYQKSEQGLSTHKDDLMEVKKVIHSAPSYVLHWYLREWASKDDNEWRAVKNFGKLSAIYTVSPGPENASNGSTIVATEDGVYHIYAKITFSCRKIDNETKRAAMRVLVEAPSRDVPKEILVASEAAQCYMFGDLVTMYQSGHFSLQAGSKLYLEYLAPSGISISRGHNRAYKSFFGVYKAAHA